MSGSSSVSSLIKVRSRHSHLKPLHGHNENDLDVGPKSKHETHLFDMYSEMPYAVSLVGLHLSGSHVEFFMCDSFMLALKGLGTFGLLDFGDPASAVCHTESRAVPRPLLL